MNNLICPKCGEKASTYEINGLWHVGCDNDKCTVTSDMFGMEIDAINNWNTKVVPALTNKPDYTMVIEHCPICGKEIVLDLHMEPVYSCGKCGYRVTESVLWLFKAEIDRLRSAVEHIAVASDSGLSYKLMREYLTYSE